MTNIILDSICALFDLSILFVYLEAVLPMKKKNLSPILYWIGLIAGEGVLFLFTLIFSGEYSPIKALMTVLLGILTTFLLAFFYNATIKYRALIAILLQVIFALSEITSAYVVIPFLTLTYSQKAIPLDEIALMSSKFVAFFFVMLIKIWWNRNKRNQILSYNLLILITPLISLFLLLLIPFPPTTNQTRNLLTIIV